MALIKGTVHLKFNQLLSKHLLVWKILNALQRGYKVSLVVAAVYEYWEKRNFQLDLEEVKRSAEEAVANEISGVALQVQAPVKKRAFLVPSDESGVSSITVQKADSVDKKPISPPAGLSTNGTPEQAQPTIMMEALPKTSRAEAAMKANLRFFEQDDDE